MKSLDWIEITLSGYLTALVDEWAALSILDRLGLLAGLALGVAVILRLRSGAVWQHRSFMGRSNWHADALRRWLLRWAVLGAFGAIAIAGGYFWCSMVGSKLVQIQPVAKAEPVELSQRLVIPRMGLDAPIVSVGFAGWQWDLSMLHDRVGHLEGTSLPGQPGNTVLAGHVTLYEGGWGPFAQLSTLQVGDRVFIVEGNHMLVFQVTETRLVTPVELSVVFPTPETRLTLITCSAWSASDGAYMQRLVVVASEERQ